MSTAKGKAPAVAPDEALNVKTTQQKAGIDPMNSKATPEAVKPPVRTAQAACDKALLEATTEALAMKVYRLMEIVKLAAFATGCGMNTKEADTSEVLYFVADELQGVSCDFTEAIYSLARDKNGGTA